MNTTAFNRSIARACRVLLVATLLVGLAPGGWGAGDVRAAEVAIGPGAAAGPACMATREYLLTTF